MKVVRTPILEANSNHGYWLDLTHFKHKVDPAGYLVGSVTCCNPAIYEIRLHGFVTIIDVTFPEAVYAYGVERSGTSWLTDAATEITAYLLVHRMQ